MRLSATVRGMQTAMNNMPDDRVVLTRAGANVASGLVIERLIAENLGASRCRIDCTADYCPDLELSDGLLVEVKLVTDSHRAPVLLMADRIAKDRELVAGGRRLAYAFCIADRTPAIPARFVDFRDELAGLVREVIVVDFARLRRLLHGRKPRKLWLADRPGWRLTVQELRTAAGNFRPRNGKRRVLTTKSVRPARTLEPVAQFNPAFTGHVHLLGQSLTPDQLLAVRGLRAELAACFLDVVTAPAPVQRHSNHRVRVVQNRNPDWYQTLANCANTCRRKRGRMQGHQDTAIHRYLLNDAIDRLLAGARPRSRYDWLVMEVISQPVTGEQQC